MKLKKLVILKTLDQKPDENSIYNYECKNGRHSISEDKVPNPGWKEAFKELNNKIDKLTEVVLTGFARQEEWNKKQEKFNEMVIQRLDRIEARLEAIENCPTIKKELKTLNQSK